jgi:hypothetical protein
MATWEATVTCPSCGVITVVVGVDRESRRARDVRANHAAYWALTARRSPAFVDAVVGEDLAPCAVCKRPIADGEDAVVVPGEFCAHVGCARASHEATISNRRLGTPPRRRQP